MVSFNKITIIGMGLIGGSIALGLKKLGHDGKIIGQDLSAAALELAKKIGAIDEYTTCLEDSVSNSDLIIIAVPIGYYEEIFKRISPCLSPGAIITDVGSVKQRAIELSEKYLPNNVQFIGGHPMAGSEKTGVAAASPFLFENAFYFLTPTNTTTSETIDKLTKVIEAIGAYPVVSEGKAHDHIVALISHIPHLMAGLLVNLLGQGGNASYLSYAGGGFRDTTRVASGNPNMWKDILIYNREEVLKGMEELQNIMSSFKEALTLNNENEVIDTLTKAKETRDSIPKFIKDAIPVTFEVFLDVQDKPGILGEVTQLLGYHGINIKEIEIVHAREGKNGALKIGFSSLGDQQRALNILHKGRYCVWSEENSRDTGGVR